MAGIKENLSFDYGNALLASMFSNLAYKQRDDNFADLFASTGWTPIGLAGSEFGPNGFSPDGIGYGVNDPLNLLAGKTSGTQSYVIAARRELPEQKTQFVIGFEGSGGLLSETADWANNVGQFGWSEHYTTLIPLLRKVLQQMLADQSDGKDVELLITGHSLGGAIAQTAFADLLAPRGNLWPTSSTVLDEAKRIYSALGDWSEATRQRILDATSVYTFGAPSFLIDPSKLTAEETRKFVQSLPTTPTLLSLITFLARAFDVVTVNDARIPKLDAVNGVSFGSKVFQFAHQNSSWYLPGDIVAQLGSRQPGNPLDINLDNDIHRSYTGVLEQFVPGATHPMATYQESVIRLVTGNTVLKSDNSLRATSPLLPETRSDAGSVTSNDYFLNRNAQGFAGNDVFIYSLPGVYAADGGLGNDIYAIKDYGISLSIDGASQSGRDALIFDLAGNKNVVFEDVDLDGVTDKATFSIGKDAFKSSVTITNWDRWQLSDLFQVGKPGGGRWALIPWVPGRGLDSGFGSGFLGDPINVGTSATKPFAELLVTAEAVGPDYASLDLSLDELIAAIRDPGKREQFVISIDAKETDVPARQSRASDTSFYRVARNRFAVDAVVATPAGSGYADNILALIGDLAGEGEKLFRPFAAEFTVAGDGKSLVIDVNTATDTEDVVAVRSALIRRPTVSSGVAYLVLDPNEDPASLSLTSLRTRTQYLLSSLEREDTTAFAASLEQGQTIGLTEGRRLAFFEVAGDSLESATEFSLLKPKALDSRTIELQTSLDMVVQLTGQGGGDAPGLEAYIARDQRNAPLLNLSGLKPTDSLTGQIVLAREADYSTNAGFYRIENTAGAVRDSVSGRLILPGEQGYAEAALNQVVGTLEDLSIADDTSAISDFRLGGDALTLLAPFAVVQATDATYTYFSFASANPDGISHFRIFGDNIIGFEDELGGGDRDYDDLVVGFRNLALA